MKTVILRSIGVSLFLICLSVSSFAEGEMGTGSKSCNGSRRHDTANKIEIKTDDTTTTVETENDFLGWLAAIFADVLN